MKQISIPNKELRLLSIQLQQFQQGYTVDQIRSLDKVVRAIDAVLLPFNTKLEEINKKPEAKDELEKFIEEEGNKSVNCQFDDIDFEFLKVVWSKMSGLSGNDVARKAILTIDDAIRLVYDPVFTQTND